MLIKEDGTFPLEPSSGMGPSSVLYISGTGSATLGYISKNEGFIALTDGALSPGEQYTVDHGFNISLMVQATGVGGDGLEILRTSKG